MTNIAFVAGIILIFKYFDNIPFFKAMTGLFLVLSIWPLREEMLFGQPNIFIFFLFCASLFCLKKRWYLPAGLLIGLGITTKEIFFLVFLFLLWQRNWKAIFSAISVMLVMRVVPIILFGWPTELSYWHYFYRLWIADNGRGSCISFYEIFHRAFDNALSPEMIKTMLVSVNIALFILTWKWIRKVRFHSGLQQNALALSMFLLLSMLISPWLRETHLVVVCLPILACWFCLDEELERKYFILFTVGYLLVGLKYSVNSFPAFASGILALVGLLKVFGCAVLFCLSGRLLAHRV